jgi:hypothetical protein
MITYFDACQSCPPGIPDASPSLGDPETVPEGQITAHECGLCGAAWNTLWRGGWPVDRKVEPVSPEQAERNKGRARGIAEAPERRMRPHPYDPDSRSTTRTPPCRCGMTKAYRGHQPLWWRWLHPGAKWR